MAMLIGKSSFPSLPTKLVFYPGSAGKLFTWTAVMQLVEQGKLDLHADINQYLDFTIPAHLSTGSGRRHSSTDYAGTSI